MVGSDALKHGHAIGDWIRRRDWLWGTRGGKSPEEGELNLISSLAAFFPLPNAQPRAGAHPTPPSASSSQLLASFLTDSAPAVAYLRWSSNDAAGGRKSFKGPLHPLVLPPFPPPLLPWLPSLGRRSYRSFPFHLASFRPPSSVSGASMIARMQRKCISHCHPITSSPFSFLQLIFVPRFLSRRRGRIPGHDPTTSTQCHVGATL